MKGTSAIVNPANVERMCLMQKELEDHIRDLKPGSQHYKEERGGRATAVGIMIGLFRLAEAIETAATSLGNSIEYGAQTIANEISDGR